MRGIMLKGEVGRGNMHCVDVLEMSLRGGQ